ncbi:pLS20_p028 family conjugation system transmembrane protein [Bacillus sp. FSL M8-0168]|uniref:pLS20_p028 family conjugation system transmembrane protein n=1 Tax=Bacillus sp. FSL M8-0168 TaxID=2921614 RepID=UPI0030FD3825
MDKAEILEKLKEFADMLNIASIPGDALRSIGWLIIQMLVTLVDSIDGLVNKIITLNGFFEDKDVVKFMETFRPVLWAAMAVAVAVLGYMYMTNKVKDKSNAFTNTLLAVCFVVLLPTMMGQLSDLATAGNNAVKGGSNSKTGSQIVKMNMADLKLYNENDFDKIGKEKIDPDKYQNQLSKDNIMNISITETVDKDGVLGKKLTQGTDGKIEAEDLDGGSFWLGIGEEYYYRWSWHFWTIVITLGMTAFSMIVSLIKISRIIFELPFKQLFGSFVAVTDLNGGQRTKQMFISIFSSFAILIIIALIMKFYMLFTSWVTTLHLGIGSIFLLIGASLAMLDGPQEVVKILGMDAGVKDGSKDMLAAYAGGKAVAGATSSVMKYGQKIASGASGIAGGVAGLKRGLSTGLNKGAGGSTSLYSAMGNAGAAGTGIGGSNAGQGAATSGLSKAASSALGDSKRDDKDQNEQINALKHQPGGIYDHQKQQEKDKQENKNQKGLNPDQNKNLIYANNSSSDSKNDTEKANALSEDLAKSKEQNLHNQNPDPKNDTEKANSLSEDLAKSKEQNLHNQNPDPKNDTEKANALSEDLAKSKEQNLHSKNANIKDSNKNDIKGGLDKNKDGLYAGQTKNEAGKGLNQVKAPAMIIDMNEFDNSEAINKPVYGDNQNIDPTLRQESPINANNSIDGDRNMNDIENLDINSNNNDIDSNDHTTRAGEQPIKSNSVNVRDGSGNIFEPGYLQPGTKYNTLGQTLMAKQLNDSFVKGHNQTYGIGMKLGSVARKIKKNRLQPDEE